ncbi:MAG: hypothetical protein U5K54_07625 [Cytophagales bacterium]|nr:hypothetical protein [Cytophagales bacterium]
MDRIKIVALTIVFLLLIGDLAIAQDSLKPKDSIHIEKTTHLIRKMDSIKVADSLKRASLLAEIENLKGTEGNRQRQALVDRLREEEAEDSATGFRCLPIN